MTFLNLRKQCGTLGGPSPDPQTARSRARNRAAAAAASTAAPTFTTAPSGHPRRSGGGGGGDFTHHQTNVHAEWQIGSGGSGGGGSGGDGSSFHAMEVEVREDSPAPDSTALLPNHTASTSSSYPLAEGTSVFTVRAEEVLLVALVLVIWVAAIALFINRWGKIRMLEPYQPKFQNQNHRASCPMAPLSPTHITPQQRMSFSKYNVNCFETSYSGFPSPNVPRRGRLNSVFVGSSMGGGASAMAYCNPPRRAKSAMDIQHLVLSSDYQLHQQQRSTHSAHILPTFIRDRRPSILFDRSYSNASASIGGDRFGAGKLHRGSLAVDRPLLAQYHQQFRNRRSSCAVDRTTGRHRNFISFDQPRRKGSMSIERSSKSYQGPAISFDMPTDTPTVIVDRPPAEPSNNIAVDINNRIASDTASLLTGGGTARTAYAVPAPRRASPLIPKISKSFEQPRIQRPPPPRMCTSLDVNVIGADNSRQHSPQPQPLPSYNNINNNNAANNNDVLEDPHPHRLEMLPLDRASPVIITLEGTQISGHLFDSLKSTDV